MCFRYFVVAFKRQGLAEVQGWRDSWCFDNHENSWEGRPRGEGAWEDLLAAAVGMGCRGHARVEEAGRRWGPRSWAGQGPLGHCHGSCPSPCSPVVEMNTACSACHRGSKNILITLTNISSEQQ